MSTKEQAKPERSPSFLSRIRNAWSGDWSAFLNNPRPTIVAVVTISLINLGFLLWFFAERFDDLDAAMKSKDATIEAMDKQIDRLRIVSGIDPADERTTYSILTNEELASKTMNIVRRIRELFKYARKRIENFEQENPKDQALPGEASQKRFQRLLAIQTEEAEKISDAIGSESIHLLRELQQRIPEEKRRHIMGAGLKFRDYDPYGKGPEARLLFGLPMGLALVTMPTFANELESLSKLLPPDLQPTDEGD